MEFRTFQDAWTSLLRRLTVEGRRVAGVVDPLSIGSSFGKYPRDFCELLGIPVKVSDPRARVVQANSYCPDLGFAIAQTIWTLAGSNSLDFIEFYNAKGRAFSDDGKTLSAAPGTRIFAHESQNQFAAAIRLLSADQHSRRAMIQIFLPQDLLDHPRDASCIGSLHFLIRESSLHSIVTMRSQAVTQVFPYDSFLLSMLHEMVAKELDIALGTYTVFSGSLHYYLDEQELVDNIIGSVSPSSPPMPPMESKMTTMRRALVHAESEIRKSLSRDIASPIEMNTFDLDAYWRTLLTVLVVETRARRGGIRFQEDMTTLPNFYRTLLTSRVLAMRGAPDANS